jgi:hypothetical protein
MVGEKFLLAIFLGLGYTNYCLFAKYAGVAQWQSSSLPSWLCGFDSHHPLQLQQNSC